MLNRIKRYSKSALNHRYGFTLFVYLTAASVTGVVCVMFMRSFEWVLHYRLTFQSIGYWAFITTPLLFLLSVALIRRLAPFSSGGIPQAIFAARYLSPTTEKKLWPLYSPFTIFLKVLTLLIALWAGASMGPEAPSVHISMGVFILVLLFFRKFMGYQFDLRSAVVAGGAAGLAAAFNTPLAGVTFAIEELTVDYFVNIKDFVLMAIIIAALSAKALTGEYAYFGRLLAPPVVPSSAVIAIGILGGLFGAFFAKALLQGQKRMSSLGTRNKKAMAVVILSLGLVLLSAVAGLNVLGPGNHAAQTLVRGQYGPWALLFPVEKILTTLFTDWSGVPAGIFAPSLSIGATLGGNVGMWLGASVASCALIGMASFLSGTIQAPITSFVIIFEMTGHHQMLLPIMLGSLIAFMVSRVLGTPHLYLELSNNYKYLIEDPAAPATTTPISH